MHMRMIAMMMVVMAATGLTRLKGSSGSDGKSEQNQFFNHATDWQMNF